MSTFLNADPLVSNLCTIGDYVIEWRWNSRDGEVIFISGKGTDPDIQAEHPIVNEVVLAGTLYPIIRYAYLNGEKYTLDFEEGALHSPDFKECLDPVVVDAVNCNTTLNPDGIYSYVLNYTNTTDNSNDRSRLIKYDIDATTAYFAWKFYAATVADQIEIYYCTLADPVGVKLENFIHGVNYITQNFYPANYPTNPKITSANYTGTAPLALATPLSAFTYQAGDYIKIQITGSVYEPTNYNTNWTVGFKCVTAAEATCTWMYDSGISKMTGTPVMTYYGDPNCYYQVSYSTQDPYSGFPTKATAPFLYKYFSAFIYTQVSSTLNWSDYAQTYNAYFPTGITTCVNLNPGQTITLTKDTNQTTWTFTDQADYDKFVNDIAALKASANYITWQGLTDQDPQYYAKFTISFPIANSCGDTFSSRGYYFWPGCPITYDGVNKTVSIQFVIPTNAIVDTECNNLYETINTAVITPLNSTKNYVIPGGASVSHVRYQTAASMQWQVLQQRHYTSVVGYNGISVQAGLLNDVCDMEALGFCLGIESANVWTMYQSYDRITLTSPATHESRLANWRLERKKFLRTDVCTDNVWETVYEATTTTTTTSTTSSTTTTTTTIATSTTTTTHTTVLDPGQNIPWGITRVGGPGDYVGTASAWILDSGIDLDHPDLNVDQVRGISFVSGNPSPDDDDGHGSHVAGIIGAINNTFGVIGIAPGVLVVPIKVLDSTGSGTFSGVLAGINYLAANAEPGDVATMSFGGGISPTIDAAVLAASANIKIAIAAGNEAEDVNIHSPARQEGANLYTVAYMANGDTWGSLSNYGMPTIDYIAPGQSIYSTYKNGGYATLSGTSMAAPHVAGILLYGSITTDGYVTHNAVNYPIAHR